MYEYVALEWRAGNPGADVVFMRDRAQRTADGWREHARAAWRPSLTGGACIMRRPKDEPQKYFHTRHCLCDECGKKRDEPRKWMEGEAKVLAQRIAGKLTLWQLHVSEWTEAQLVSVIQEVLTRPVSASSSFSEPRMWTKADIQEIVRTTPVVTYADE